MCAIHLRSSSLKLDHGYPSFALELHEKWHSFTQVHSCWILDALNRLSEALSDFDRKIILLDIDSLKRNESWSINILHLHRYVDPCRTLLSPLHHHNLHWYAIAIGWLRCTIYHWIVLDWNLLLKALSPSPEISIRNLSILDIVKALREGHGLNRLVILWLKLRLRNEHWVVVHSILNIVWLKVLGGWPHISLSMSECALFTKWAL